ncbi:MAG TPA: helix-turn-helix domain-containing protein [Pirellulaceae bacterium]|jgi:excisionase family DNA binding protein
MTEQVLIKSKEAARLLAVCPRTLHSLTHGGGLPFVRMGRCLRYDMVELAKWIEAKTRREALPNGQESN